jgi:hypothetical protein
MGGEGKIVIPDEAQRRSGIANRMRRWNPLSLRERVGVRGYRLIRRRRNPSPAP